ncbi:MAG TPA: hypothetical protein DEG43_13060 [Acidimicrobiaceae bacterium]|nr:hypothetical protein [Acidimicrobiaceae bacterium]
MLALTEHLGQKVLDAAGHKRGRVVELLVDMSDPSARILRVGVGNRSIQGRHTVATWIDWTDIASFESTSVQCRPEARFVEVEKGTRVLDPADNFLWLNRDVLDTQIINPEGGHIVRVGEIALVRVGEDLQVIAIEFGAGPVARRLGLAWLGERLETTSIDWHDLHLVSGRGLTAQLATNSDRYRSLSAAELAKMVAQISPGRGTQLLAALGAHQAAEVLAVSHPDLNAGLVHDLPHHLASEIISEMHSDDAVATLRRQHSGHIEALLANLATDRARELRALLAHPPTSAGGLMTIEIAVANAEEPLADICERLRMDPTKLHRFGGVVRVSDDRTPVGFLSLTALVAQSEDPLLSPYEIVRADTAVEDVISLFATHDIFAAVVVDETGRCIGGINIDDVLEELVAEQRPGRRKFKDLVDRHSLGGRRARASARHP